MRGVLVFMSLFFVLGCTSDVQPKPTGYLRLKYPVAAYTCFDDLSDFSFEYNTNALVKVRSQVTPRLAYPNMRATLYLNYVPVENNLDSLLNDAYKLPFKHISKAESIPEKVFVNDQNKVYGTLFSVVGNAASQHQFFLTDSLDHFLVGSLYFYARPNFDSIYPAAVYIQKDIVRLMETLKWK